MSYYTLEPMQKNFDSGKAVGGIYSPPRQFLSRIIVFFNKKAHCITLVWPNNVFFNFHKILVFFKYRLNRMKQRIFTGFVVIGECLSGDLQTPQRNTKLKQDVSVYFYEN